jgi:hypothetical protein
MNLVLAELTHGRLFKELLPEFKIEKPGLHQRAGDDGLDQLPELCPADLGLGCAAGTLGNCISVTLLSEL